jgi:hypothetical protein
MQRIFGGAGGACARGTGHPTPGEKENRGSWSPTLSAIRLRKGWGTRHSQRPYGAHGFGGRTFPGLRYAPSRHPTDEDLSVGTPSGAIFLLSLREERQRVEVHRLHISKSRCGPPAQMVGEFVV